MNYTYYTLTNLCLLDHSASIPVLARKHREFQIHQTLQEILDNTHTHSIH